MDSDERDFEHPEIDVTDDEPYSDVELSNLPVWWRNAVEEFRAHGLKPYHPPVFEDGVYKHRVVGELEDRLGIEVDFINTEVPASDEWAVRVDNRSVGTIPRRRDSGGYSVYEMGSEEFREWVLERVPTDDEP